MSSRRWREDKSSRAAAMTFYVLLKALAEMTFSHDAVSFA
jgi:hypothetical protein